MSFGSIARKGMLITSMLALALKSLPALSESEVSKYIQRLQQSKPETIHLPESNIWRTNYSKELRNFEIENEFYHIAKLSYTISSDGKKRMQVGLVRADSKGAYYHIIFDEDDSAKLDGKPDKVLKMYLSLSEILRLKKLFDEGGYSTLEMITKRYKDKETLPDRQSLRFYDEVTKRMFQ